MQIMDMHIHNFGGTPDPAALLGKMRQAGVFGGCVFSDWPQNGDFDTRLDAVLKWTEGYPNRLFPVMWIHPYEENIFENIHKAVDRGICAFKMICTDYDVYEETPMALLTRIAELGKPVFFHSGILWDGEVSSNHNRPLNWEALLKIKGLRFSMGHCSWPWIDECIAMYGKFLNAGGEDRGEMFFDITPGTPEIYRRELLTKLFTVGYDVGDNILFGTDASADSYRAAWCAKWLRIDGEIMDELGVSLQIRQKLYRDNLLRFLGKTEAAHRHVGPECDDDKQWSAVRPDMKDIIEDMYLRLNFPKDYNREFYKALEEIPISDAITLEGYDKSCEDGTRNLLSFLYFAHLLEEKYEEKGISKEIFLHTMGDIVTWTNTWSQIKGRLYLGELPWLSGHLSMKLFRLGRLQFRMGHDADRGNVIEIHIPEGEPLDPARCRDSIEKAKAFFAEFYPEFEYAYFSCHSWLLDSAVSEMLGQDSNIAKFRNMFEITREDDSYALLTYIFTWDTNIRNLPTRVSRSSFAERVKKSALGGKVFHESMGYIHK